MKPPTKKASTEISETRFKALLENALDGIVLYDNNGTIMYAAPSAETVSGYSAAEALGKNGTDFVHPDHLHNAIAAFKNIVKKPGKSTTLIQQLKHKKGHYYWSESVLTNFSHVPEINGIVSNFRDITEKIVAQEQARKTQGLLETISQNLSEGVYMGIIGKEYVYVNNAFLKILGYSSIDEFKQTSPADLFAEGTRRLEIIQQLRTKAGLKEVEAELVRKNGERFWGRVNVTLLTGEKGKEGYFVGTVRDISQEKIAALKLEESRNFLNNIINTVAAPIFVKDEKHRLVIINDFYSKMIQIPPEQLIGKTDRANVEKREADTFWKIDSHVLKTGETVVKEEKLTVKGKTHDFITIKSRSINEKNEKFVIGFITDVTEFKRVEKEIKQLNANLQGVMESTNESIYAIDKNFEYTSFNKNHKRVMKLLYNADIRVGMNKLKTIEKSKDEKWLTAELKRAMKGNHFVSERKLDYPQYRDRYIQLTYNPIYGENNAVEGVAVFVSDITERKHYESKLNSLNEELTQQNWQLAAQEEELKAAMEELSERNFELDQLMYKTSHDLRSPLSSVMGLVSLLQVDKNLDNQKLYLEKVEDRIKKLDEFIRSMLNYAQANRADVNMSTINLKRVAEVCIRELEYLDNFKSVRTEVKIENEGIAFRSDLLRINIIFGNIISNAYKYYNSEVKSFLKIKITLSPLLATIEFKDNGIGIRSEYQKKIFDMFYRATEKSQGSGLGMYIVKQAIEKLNGTITLKSTYGKGTTLKITLPNM